MTIGKYSGCLIKDIEKKGSNVRLSTVQNAEKSIMAQYGHIVDGENYIHKNYSNAWYREEEFKLMQHHNHLTKQQEAIDKVHKILKEKEAKHKSFHERQVKLREQADRESAKRLEAKKKRAVKAKAASKAPTMSKGISLKNISRK